jgi:cytochrome b
MALATLGLTEKAADVGIFRQSLTQVHVALGFALATALIFRILWGMVGPEHARFKNLWKSAFGPQVDKANRPFGYERVASIAYIFLYLIVGNAVLSGLLLTAVRYDQGPFAELLFDEVSSHQIILKFHNGALYALAIFTVAHLIGMVRHEKKFGVPVAQSMVSGFKYRLVKCK